MSEPEAGVRETRGELAESLAVLRLRKWSILLVTVAVVASTMFFSLRQTPLYESSAKVLVKPVTLSSGAAAALPAQ